MNALQAHHGVVEVTSTVTASANHVTVLIRSHDTTARAIARVAEEALESDPANRAPVTVIIE